MTFTPDSLKTKQLIGSRQSLRQALDRVARRYRPNLWDGYRYPETNLNDNQLIIRAVGVALGVPFNSNFTTLKSNVADAINSLT